MWAWLVRAVAGQRVADALAVAAGLPVGAPGRQFALDAGLQSGRVALRFAGHQTGAGRRRPIRGRLLLLLLLWLLLLLLRLRRPRRAATAAQIGRTGRLLAAPQARPLARPAPSEIGRKESGHLAALLLLFGRLRFPIFFCLCST